MEFFKLQVFEIPDRKHFLLSPDSEESCINEIIGYTRKRHKTVTYDVLFNDDCWEVPVEVKDMMEMLQDSLLDSLYFLA